METSTIELTTKHRTLGGAMSREERKERVTLHCNTVNACFYGKHFREYETPHPARLSDDRLVRTPVAVHLLPSEKESTVFARLRA
jgi:hypothetical protein